MPNIFQILLERQHLTKVLLENRLEFLKGRYVPLLTKYLEELIRKATDENDYNHSVTEFFRQLSHGGIKIILPTTSGYDPNQITKNSSELFDWLVFLDPTATKKYSQWILNIFLSQGELLYPEDGYKVTDNLTDFERIKHLMPVQQRDINRLKSFAQLLNVISPYKDQMSKADTERLYKEEMKGQAKILYDDSNYKIVVPLTQEAACFFGVNTQWCTAAKNNNAFDHYNSKGDLYIILDKKSNRRWQFHFESSQLMDEHDHPIYKSEFVEQHPEIEKIFLNLDRKNEVLRTSNDNYVVKTDRSYVLKNGLGLLGRTVFSIMVDKDNKFVDFYTSSYSNDVEFNKLSTLLNKLKIIGNENGDEIAHGLYYRKGKWGTIAQVGNPILKIKKNGETVEWKSVTVAGTITDYGKVFHDVTVFVALKNNKLIQNFHLTLSNNRLYMENPAVLGIRASDFIFELIKARKDIKYFDRQSYFSFTNFTQRKQEWLLKNRPTFCPPEFSYQSLGAAPPVKEAILSQIQGTELAEYDDTRGENKQFWVDDYLVAYELSDRQIQKYNSFSFYQNRLFSKPWISWRYKNANPHKIESYKKSTPSSYNDVICFLLVPIKDIVGLFEESSNFSQETWFNLWLINPPSLTS